MLKGERMKTYRCIMLLLTAIYISIFQGCNSAGNSILPVSAEPEVKSTTYGILPGSSVPVEKDVTLIISRNHQPDTTVGIERIDKEQLRVKGFKNSSEHKLAPGRHTVFYYFVDQRHFSAISSVDLNISFSAKEAHIYELKNYVQWDDVFPVNGEIIGFLTMIIDTTEGEVVALKRRGIVDFKEEVHNIPGLNLTEWTEKNKIKIASISNKNEPAVTFYKDEYDEQNECHLNCPYNYIPLYFLNRGNQYGLYKVVFLGFAYKGNKYGIYFNASRVTHEKLSSLSPLLYGKGTVKITKKDFIFQRINDQLQREKLLPLVEKIRSLTSDVHKQARIAISLVQSIPYGFPTVDGSKVNYDKKYPYGVIWEGTGICDEKADLLLFLLRELGFGTAALVYKKDNHRAVGIRCPDEYDVDDSGYCYVEVTTPRIITDNMPGLESTGYLTDPEIIKISDGIQLEGVDEEFKDKNLYYDLINKAKAKNWSLDQNEYDQYCSILNKYDIE